MPASSLRSGALSMPRPLRIGFLCPHNPLDRQEYSGTAHFAMRALDQNAGVDVTILGPHKPRSFLDLALRRKPPQIDPTTLALDNLDAVVGLVATPLLDGLLALKPKVPVFHVTDATPAFLREAYGWAVPETADAAERRVATRATATIYSSMVMAERAPRDLDLPDFVTHAIPFGINADHLAESAPAKPSLNRLNLLFIGLDWVRKGGDIAVAALDRLLAAGVDAHLTIVGAGPEALRRHPAITYMGYVSKNRPREAAMLERLYREAHLLLLPSRGDCTPMVIGEAMASGTPVIASDTGGISAMIGGPGAGRIMPQFADPELWASTIRDITQDPESYRMMSDAAFDRATTTLSWTTWATKVERVVLECIRVEEQRSAA